MRCVVKMRKSSLTFNWARCVELEFSEDRSHAKIDFVTGTDLQMTGERARELYDWCTVPHRVLWARENRAVNVLNIAMIEHDKDDAVLVLSNGDRAMVPAGEVDGAWLHRTFGAGQYHGIDGLTLFWDHIHYARWDDGYLTVEVSPGRQMAFEGTEVPALRAWLGV